MLHRHKPFQQTIILSVFAYVWYRFRNPLITPCCETIQTYNHIPVRNKRLLNFSAGAGYWIYYLGIAKFIQQNYDLSETDFVGTSAGAFMSSLLSQNVKIDTIFKEALQHLERCRQNTLGVFGYWNISYSQAIIDGCRKLDVCPTRNHCNYIGVSRLTVFGFKKQYLDAGLSPESLATSLMVSCWIPFLTAPLLQPLINIQNALYGDGFWTGRDKTKHERHLIIHPNKFRILPLSTYWLWTDEAYNIRMFHLGYDDAKANRQLFDDFFREPTVSTKPPKVASLGAKLPYRRCDRRDSG
jgi:hypothetical protein